MTAKIVEMAKTAGVSVEGEIGFVGYSDGESSAGTLPEDAARFAAESGVDAMAVSIRNVHLQQEKAAELDIAALRAIEALTSVPLVIHGGSGVPVETRRFLAKESKICKFNIVTELRMAFGQALRTAVNLDPNRFDRVTILKETEYPVQLAAQQVIRAFGAPAQR